MATGVDRIAQVLSNRRLAAHLRWVADTVIDDKLAQAWIREAARRVRGCNCPRIVEVSTGAAGHTAAVDGLVGEGGAHTIPGQPANGEAS